jgi:hypothetical protein
MMLVTFETSDEMFRVTVDEKEVAFITPYDNQFPEDEIAAIKGVFEKMQDWGYCIITEINVTEDAPQSKEITS